MDRAARSVREHGKLPVAWDEAGLADPASFALLQAWRPRAQLTAEIEESVRRAARAGAKVVMSPGTGPTWT
ncbi:hypothetical protein ACFQZC_08050 [Streptacidiphilus monticola]